MYVELIGTFLSIILLLLKWFFGNKAMRAQRAREVLNQFKQVSIDGDKLWDQILVEQNRTSNTNWEDIPVRQGENSETH